MDVVAPEINVPLAFREKCDMSAFKEALLSGLEEYLQRLQVAIEGLTPAERTLLRSRR